MNIDTTNLNELSNNELLDLTKKVATERYLINKLNKVDESDLEVLRSALIYYLKNYKDKSSQIGLYQALVDD